jgi:hypothetical protein
MENRCKRSYGGVNSTPEAAAEAPGAFIWERSVNPAPERLTHRSDADAVSADFSRQAGRSSHTYASTG